MPTIFLLDLMSRPRGVTLQRTVTATSKVVHMPSTGGIWAKPTGLQASAADPQAERGTRRIADH
ncbi:hypothetical protein, partial [Phenylobacterium sp.]|uniref:hypothetical protein n=1 Tax=Phenylobacterium sp. TaxID=1871053 RepID=UPI002F401DDF